eukprot:jgi/Botrbrau1/14821/Bobra.168_3s0003.1
MACNLYCSVRYVSVPNVLSANGHIPSSIYCSVGQLPARLFATRLSFVFKMFKTVFGFNGHLWGNLSLHGQTCKTRKVASKLPDRKYDEAGGRRRGMNRVMHRVFMLMPFCMPRF